MTKRFAKNVTVIIAAFTLSVLMVMGVMAKEDEGSGLFSLNHTHVTVDQYAGTTASSIRMQDSAAGSVVELIPRNNAGWVFAGWDVLGVDEYDIDDSDVLTFIMPSNNVSIVDTWIRYNAEHISVCNKDEWQCTRIPEVNFSTLWTILRLNERLHCFPLHICFRCFPVRFMFRLF